MSKEQLKFVSVLEMNTYGVYQLNRTYRFAKVKVDLPEYQLLDLLT